MLCCVSATGHDKLIKSLLPLLLALLSACGATFHGPAGRVDETGRLRCDTQLTAEGVWHCKRCFAHKAQRVDAINAATQAARASLRSALRGALNEQQLAMKNGERLGVAGLRVWIEPGYVREGGQVCEGEAFSMVIRASEPAWMRLYSLDEAGRVVADGRNWRAPKPMTEWRLEDASVLPTPLHLPDAPRDRLVVVAIPADEDPEAGFSPLPEHGVGCAAAAFEKANIF
jgi:hypothetical protein